MKFVTFRPRQGDHGAALVGVVADGQMVLDLGEAARLAGEPLDASSMIALIRQGPEGLACVRKLFDIRSPTALHLLEEVELLAPIPRPAKNIFCVGRNYLDHAREGDRMFGRQAEIPLDPHFFSKAATSVTGPDSDVLHPAALTQALDYEVELGVIIGTGGRDIPRDRAMNHVFGYTIINDVSARDLQKTHGQWFKGKSLDTSCPMGPWIVDAAEIGDPRSLEISFHLNGVERQRATVDMLIFDIATIIESLSAGMTLEAGDVIATGTPAGVGFAMEPKGLLGDGDIMECRVDRIGLLRNKVVQV